MLKRRSLVVFFSIAIVWKSSSCVTSYQDALVWVASFALLRFDKNLCFKNIFLHLSLCLRVVMGSSVNTQHSIGCLLVFSWYDVITCEKYTNHRCALSDAFFYNFLIFDVPQYSNRCNYIKDIRPAICFNNHKKSLHITFAFGWAAGRTSGLGVKTEWCCTGMAICLEQGANDLHVVQLTPLPPHHFLLH